MMATALRYFVEVARAGSFRSAADAVHVAASALNRQISNLEKQLGALLFERRAGRNRLRLTEAGEVLLRHVRSAMSELERARYEIESLKGLQSGHVHLGAPETFARDFLPDFLAEFHKAYPFITFRVVVNVSPKLVDLLVDDDIEVALLFNPADLPQVKVLAEVKLDTCVMVPEHHPLAKHKTVRLSDCARFPIVMPDYGTSVRPLYDQMLARAGIKPTSIVTTTSYELLRSAARAGLGLAIVNQYVASPESAPAGVVFIPIRDRAVKPQVLACCVRAERRLSVAATVMIDSLKQALRRHARDKNELFSAT